MLNMHAAGVVYAVCEELHDLWNGPAAQQFAPALGLTCCMLSMLLYMWRSAL
jgi:hypothetical protein